MNAFVRGMFSAFDVAPTLRIDLPSDSDAIRGDWETITGWTWRDTGEPFDEVPEERKQHMKVIRDYVWDTFGEAVRGVEVTVAVVLLTALQDMENVTDLGSWATGVGVAVIVAAAAYVKGRLPATKGE
mgnify:FL=1